MKSFRLIADISEKPLFLLDGEGTVLGFNRKASELYSLCAENAGEVKICSLCRNSDRQCSFSNLFSGGYRQKITHGAVHSLAENNSVRVILELHPFVQEEEDGDVKIICTVRPAEDEPDRRDEGKLPFLFNSLSSMVYVIDPDDFSLLYMNGHALNVLNVKGNWRGEKCWKIIHGFDEKCRHCSLTAGAPADGTAEEIFNSRSRRWYLETGRQISWDNGRDVRLVISHDIDERKKLELLREDVERIMRHDLKTPLNSICLLGQTLEFSAESEDSRFLASKIIEACFQLNAMINLSQILYRLEKGDYRVVKKKVLLNDLLGRICSHLEGLAASYQVHMEQSFPAECAGGFFVSADDLLLYSCLSNLVKNAVEASPEGGTVLIECGTADGLDTIAVTNRGDVPYDIVGSFFDKYVTKGKAGGTGLGTYSAKLLAEAHGGSISLETGRGFTCVRVSLPQS
ncbi:MAG: ATP-binding protein [Deferribacterales bacterium]